MAEAVGPRIVIDLQHGRALDPEPIEKPLEMWELAQRRKDIAEHTARRQADLDRDERKDQARETLRKAAEQDDNPIARAVLELLDD